MDPSLRRDITAHPAHARRIVQSVMKRQLSLSLWISAVFVVLLFAVPMINKLAPELANTPVFGFTASWLFLAVLFYPITWILSYIFINRSDKIEAEIAVSLDRELTQLHKEASELESPRA